jgi:hypothetical protein
MRCWRLTSELSLLLDALDEAFDRQSWHGPNLRGALRGVSAELAAWRPQPGRHSIWELAVHAAYWKYVVRRRITGEKRGSFQLKGSNFFPTPDPPSVAAWRQAVMLLEEEHRLLRAVVAGLGAPVQVKMIRGAAAHDLYHAGQIQLIKRLFRDRPDKRAAS